MVPSSKLSFTSFVERVNTGCHVTETAIKVIYLAEEAVKIKRTANNCKYVHSLFSSKGYDGCTNDNPISQVNECNLA